MKYINNNLKTQEIYELIAKKFRHPGVTLFRGRELVTVSNYFKRHQIPNNKKVLDLGCGEGDVACILFNRVSVGTDILPKELSKAKKLNLYDRLVVSDARNLPFDDGTFDIVFSNSVIEHIKGIEKVLSEISRVLKSNGIFVFTSPSKYFAKYLYFTKVFNELKLSFVAKKYAQARNMQLDHFNQYNVGGWRKILKTFSLEVTYHKYYLSKPEMVKWDQICILRKLSSFSPRLLKWFDGYFSNEVNGILSKKSNLTTGGSLMIVARKKKDA